MTLGKYEFIFILFAILIFTQKPIFKALCQKKYVTDIPQRKGYLYTENFFWSKWNKIIQTHSNCSFDFYCPNDVLKTNNRTKHRGGNVNWNMWYISWFTLIYVYTKHMILRWVGCSHTCFEGWGRKLLHRESIFTSWPIVML